MSRLTLLEGTLIMVALLLVSVVLGQTVDAVHEVMP